MVGVQGWWGPEGGWVGGGGGPWGGWVGGGGVQRVGGYGVMAGG